MSETTLVWVPYPPAEDREQGTGGEHPARIGDRERQARGGRSRRPVTAGRVAKAREPRAPSESSGAGRACARFDGPRERARAAGSRAPRRHRKDGEGDGQGEHEGDRDAEHKQQAERAHHRDRREQEDEEAGAVASAAVAITGPPAAAASTAARGGDETERSGLGEAGVELDRVVDREPDQDRQTAIEAIVRLPPDEREHAEGDRARPERNGQRQQPQRRARRRAPGRAP